MLGSCIIVASLPPPTNIISPHAVLWPAWFCRADYSEFAASCCRYPWFQFQRWFCICLEIMSSPFLIKASVTLDLKSVKLFCFVFRTPKLSQSYLYKSYQIM